MLPVALVMGASTLLSVGAQVYGTVQQTKLMTASTTNGATQTASNMVAQMNLASQKHQADLTTASVEPLSSSGGRLEKIASA